MGGCDNDDDNDGNHGGSDGVRDGDHVSDVDRMMICRSHIDPSHSRLPYISVASSLSTRCQSSSLSPSRTSSTEWFGARESRPARHGRRCRRDGKQGKESGRE